MWGFPEALPPCPDNHVIAGRFLERQRPGTTAFPSWAADKTGRLLTAIDLVPSPVDLEKEI